MSAHQNTSFKVFNAHFCAGDDLWLASQGVEALQVLVRQQVERCIQHAGIYFPALPEPRVWCDLRGKSAGQAHFSRGGLRFNTILLAEQPRPFLNQVVPHEVAHWVVHFGISKRVAPHGREWRHVMSALFGIAPETTHCFDVSRASPAPYCYHCQCRDSGHGPRVHRFSLRRHNLALKGRRYVCRYCKGILHFVGVDEGKPS